MRITRRHISRMIAATFLAGLGGLAGCAHQATRVPCCQPPAVALPDTQRGSVEQNILTLPTVGGSALDPLPTPPYKALTPIEAQCLAAANAPLAQLHLSEISTARDRHHLNRDAGAALRRDLLAYTAEELQNRTAGGALELYYRIAEAEAKSDLLAEALTQLNDAISETKKIVEQQLKPPVELDVWERQELQSRTDRLQAEMTIDQLNTQLQALIGAIDGERWRIWNPEGYHVPDVVVDPSAAVAEGLRRRPELALLRRLHSGLNEKTLPVARDMISTLNPLLGRVKEPMLDVVATLAELFRLMPGAGQEVAVRRQQIAEYLAAREQAVAAEIRQAAETLVYRGRLVALARQRERSREQDVQEIKARQEEGLASFAQVAEANLEWLKARADLVEAVMAWQIAQVKLREAQGVLAAECSEGTCAPIPSVKTGLLRRK